tara:strand:+ start:592 stop:738 length:147 start_codon:yes stop_codon:yes gene_type:complete
MRIVSWGKVGNEFYFRLERNGEYGKIQINLGLLLQEFEDDIVWQDDEE